MNLKFKFENDLIQTKKSDNGGDTCVISYLSCFITP